MSIYDELEEKIKESFAYSLHDKLIFISGYLEGDDENEDLLNFVNYLLYSEKENVSFPSLSVTPSIDWSNTTYTDESFRKTQREKCKTCTEYKKDFLFSRCKDCCRFSQWNVRDLYSEIEVENAK